MEVVPLDKYSLQITIDAKLYSLDVIHKCFYWYGSKISVDIKSEQDLYIITITDEKTISDIESIISKIKSDLIDFRTREIIFNETKNIREILIAKAFAHGEEFDENPPWNIHDLVGSDPSKI